MVTASIGTPKMAWKKSGSMRMAPCSPNILTSETKSQDCELFAIEHDVLLRVPMHGFDSVLETAYTASLLRGKPSHDLNTGPMYHVSMEEAPSGAAWPGDKLPFPMIHVNVPHFGSKSVHP